jgi:hypothetical protein
VIDCPFPFGPSITLAHKLLAWEHKLITRRPCGKGFRDLHKTSRVQDLHKTSRVQDLYKTSRVQDLYKTSRVQDLYKTSRVSETCTKLPRPVQDFAQHTIPLAQL